MPCGGWIAYPVGLPLVAGGRSHFIITRNCKSTVAQQCGYRPKPSGAGSARAGVSRLRDRVSRACRRRPRSAGRAPGAAGVAPGSAARLVTELPLPGSSHEPLPLPGVRGLVTRAAPVAGDPWARHMSRSRCPGSVGSSHEPLPSSLSEFRTVSHPFCGICPCETPTKWQSRDWRGGSAGGAPCRTAEHWHRQSLQPPKPRNRKIKCAPGPANLRERPAWLSGTGNPVPQVRWLLIVAPDRQWKTVYNPLDRGDRQT
jgi:hypothetical protein